VEKLVTDASDSAVTMYKWPNPSASSSYDATIWRYTPDVEWDQRRPEGRDYDFYFTHVARQNKTAYSTLSADSSRMYVNFDGHNQGLYRWVAQVLIDDSGKHIAYFACDPKITAAGKDERNAVLIYDGKVFAGPFPAVSHLFLSPSGKHVAYSLTVAGAKFFVDRKIEAKTGAILDAEWSPDETHIAFVAAGNHGKVFVVGNGKRSPLFEQIGHVGWTPDGKTILFTAISNGRVVTVRQSF
jgi:hypothetical protein